MRAKKLIKLVLVVVFGVTVFLNCGFADVRLPGEGFAVASGGGKYLVVCSEKNLLDKGNTRITGTYITWKGVVLSKFIIDDNGPHANLGIAYSLNEDEKDECIVVWEKESIDGFRDPYGVIVSIEKGDVLVTNLNSVITVSEETIKDGNFIVTKSKYDLPFENVTYEGRELKDPYGDVRIAIGDASILLAYASDWADTINICIIKNSLEDGNSLADKLLAEIPINTKTDVYLGPEKPGTGTTVPGKDNGNDGGYGGSDEGIYGAGKGGKKGGSTSGNKPSGWDGSLKKPPHKGWPGQDGVDPLNKDHGGKAKGGKGKGKREAEMKAFELANKGKNVDIVYGTETTTVELKTDLDFVYDAMSFYNDHFDVDSGGSKDIDGDGGGKKPWEDAKFILMQMHPDEDWEYDSDGDNVLPDPINVPNGDGSLNGKGNSVQHSIKAMHNYEGKQPGAGVIDPDPNSPQPGDGGDGGGIYVKGFGWIDPIPDINISKK